MNTPPLLLGVTCLFWGWQTGYFLLAALVAVLLESARVVKTRWEYSNTDFNRLWDLCTVLFLGAAVVAFTANDGINAVTNFVEARSFTARSGALSQAGRSVLTFVQWLPMIYLPLAAAQAYSQRNKIELTTFSWFLRRQKAKSQYLSATASRGGINVAWPYFSILIVSASAANVQTAGYYAGTSALLLWALWGLRSRRFSASAWAALAAVVVVLGYFGHTGLHRLQRVVENLQTDWFMRFARQGFDSDENRTALGQIGRLKLSGRIALRVEVPPGQPVPSLLREASHNAFRWPYWSSAGSARELAQTLPESDETTWVLLPATNTLQAVTVSRSLNGGHGLLALPIGARRIERLPVFELKTNRLGAVSVSEGPGLVVYETHFASGASLDSPPELDGDKPPDLDVPEKERPALDQMVSALKLRDRPVPEALKVLEAFFQRNFEYSTWLGDNPTTKSNSTELAAFLLNRRAGHCEYFATATVLLLRAAGIPARYAVGWSVQERARRGFVVRDRHAHAWCLAWVDGAWRDFDTTPGSWNQAEAEKASFWEPLADAWSRVWFEFQKFRWGKSGFRAFVPWLLGLLLIAMLARLFFKRQWTRRRSERQKVAAPAVWPGLDSEFFAVERKLAELGLGRRPSETFGNWLARVQTAPNISVSPLVASLALHNRHRFDPHGLSAAERIELSAAVQGWLAEISPGSR